MGMRLDGLGRPREKLLNRHTRVARPIYMKCGVEENLFRAGPTKTAFCAADPVLQRVISPALWLALPIAQVLKYASGEVPRAIVCYLSNKDPEQKGVRFLRSGAMVATALAGLIPLLQKSLQPMGGRTSLRHGPW